jgi:hypothetical protein
MDFGFVCGRQRIRRCRDADDVGNTVACCARRRQFSVWVAIVRCRLCLVYEWELRCGKVAQGAAGCWLPCCFLKQKAHHGGVGKLYAQVGRGQSRMHLCY